MRRRLSVIFTVSLLALSFWAFPIPSAEAFGEHDVAILDVSLFQSMLAGANVSANVAVENQGTANETFNVTLYVNELSIQTLTVTCLEPQSNLTLIFECKIFPYRIQIFPPPWDNPLQVISENLIIKAEADVVPGEVDTTDNIYVNGLVNVSWMVTDVNGDGKIDMKDIGPVARGFDSRPGDPRWDQMFDFNSDGRIDMRDIGTSARLFAAEYFPSPIPWLAIGGGNRANDYWVVSPETPSVNNTLFNASITLRSPDLRWNLCNVSLFLRFNDTTILLQGVEFAQFWGTTDYSYTSGSPGVSLGEIHINVKDPENTPNEDTPIATITFNVTFKERYFDTSLLDIHDETLFCPIQEIPTKPEQDGLVEIYHSPLSKPRLAVEPALTVFAKYEFAVGELFNVSIVALDATGWNLYNATLRLSFEDWVLLDMVSIFFDPIWKVTGYNYTPGSQQTPIGEIQINAKDPETTVNANTTIATITFRVTHQNQVPDPDLDSPLDIHDEKLFNPFQEIPTKPAYDGYVLVEAFL